MVVRSLFSALLHGTMVSVISILVSIIVGIVGGIIIFVLMLLARTEEQPIAVIIFISILAVAMSMLAWTQTMRYAGAMIGYRSLARMPPFGAAWMATTLAAIVLTILLAVVLAAIAFLALLLLGIAPDTTVGALDETFVQSILAPENALFWIIGYIGLTNLVQCVWTMALTPLACGPAARPGSYSFGLIFARLFISVPFFTLVGVGLALLLASTTLEDLVQSLNPGATSMNPILVVSFLPGWLCVGWIMAFEILLLGTRPTISKAEVEAFDAPSEIETQDDFRALRKQWQQR